MKYVVITKSKHEQEIKTLQKQLTSEQEKICFLSEKVESLVSSQAEAEITTKHLRNQLEKAFGKVISLINLMTNYYDHFIDRSPYLA